MLLPYLAKFFKQWIGDLLGKLCPDDGEPPRHALRILATPQAHVRSIFLWGKAKRRLD